MTNIYSAVPPSARPLAKVASPRLLAPVAARAVFLFLSVFIFMAGAGQAQAQDATCKDIYEIYQTCYDGGKEVEMEGCRYLIEALGPRLLGEDGLSGFSAALSVGICKRACQDGASGRKAMPMSVFRKEFCGSQLK